MRQLDRRRKFATTYGDDPRRYYQDGVYFDAHGNEYGAETPKAADEVSVAAEIESAPAAPSDAVTPAEALDALAQQPEPEAEPEPQVASGERGLKAQLDAMPVARVRSVFMQAKGPEELTKGEGSKARMVAWLVEQAAAQAG